MTRPWSVITDPAPVRRVELVHRCLSGRGGHATHPSQAGGNYTSPELIKKFEETYDVKVSITDYDLNDTALAKVQGRRPWFRYRSALSDFVPIWI